MSLSCCHCRPFVHRCARLVVCRVCLRPADQTKARTNIFVAAIDSRWIVGSTPKWCSSSTMANGKRQTTLTNFKDTEQPTRHFLLKSIRFLHAKAVRVRNNASAIKRTHPTRAANRQPMPMAWAPRHNLCNENPRYSNGDFPFYLFVSPFGGRSAHAAPGSTAFNAVSCRNLIARSLVYCAKYAIETRFIAFTRVNHFGDGEAARKRKRRNLRCSAVLSIFANSSFEFLRHFQ